MQQSSNDENHWRRTRNLMLSHLAVWFFFGYVIHMFVKPLNTIIVPFLGFPLGFYMFAQGSLIIYLIIIAIYVRAMNRLDRRHGVGERR